jgi:hypothetical protein
MAITGIGIDDAHVDLATATAEQLLEASNAALAEILRRAHGVAGLETLAEVQAVLDGDGTPENPALTAVGAIVTLEQDIVDGAAIILDFDAESMPAMQKRWLKARAEALELGNRHEVKILDPANAGRIRMGKAVAIAALKAIEAELR